MIKNLREEYLESTNMSLGSESTNTPVLFEKLKGKKISLTKPKNLTEPLGTYRHFTPASQE